MTTTATVRKPLSTLNIYPFAVPVRLVDNFVCGGVQDNFLLKCSVSARGLTEEGFVFEVRSFKDGVRNAYLDTLLSAEREHDFDHDLDGYEADSGSWDSYDGDVGEINDHCLRSGAAPTFKASCEELAGGVVHAAHQMLGERLEGIRVEVRNLTGSVTLVWERGDEVPEFPRLATPEEIQATKDAREMDGFDEDFSSSMDSYAHSRSYAPRRSIC